MAVDAYKASCLAWIGPNETLRTAARSMCDHRVGLLVVERDAELCGVISDRDIAFAVAADKQCADRCTVADVMSASPTTVDAAAPLRDAIAAMRQHGIRRLPVVDGASGVKGVLAADDLLRLLAHELAELAAVAEQQSRPSPTNPPRPARTSVRGRVEHYLT